MLRGLLLLSVAIAVYSQVTASTPVACPYTSREACPTSSPASVFFNPSNNNVLPSGVTPVYSANVNCTSTVTNGFTASLAQVTSIASASVNTFGTTITGRYPASTSLTQGVYQFTLFGDTLCGRVASAPVTVVARCPMPPTAVGSAVAADGTALPSVNGVSQIRRGVDFLIVGQNSVAAQFVLPGNLSANPTTMNSASSFMISTYSWVATSTPGAQFLDSSGNACVPNTPCQCRTIAGASPTGSTTNCANTLVRVNVAGSATFTITVSDGCSSSTAAITVSITCGCAPTPQASAFPTVWTNVVNGTNRATAATLNNLWSSAWTAANPVFTLTGSTSFIYDVPNSDLGYDWNFVSWIPDYSARFGSQTYAQLTSFVPPTTGAACSTTAGPGSANTGCWTSANVVANMPARTGAFQYFATQAVTPPASASDVRSWTSGARSKNITFMRYAPSTCVNSNNPGVPSTFTTPSQTNATSIAYSTFPTFTDNVGDFNGFVTSTGAAYNNRFRPTTQFQISRETTTTQWTATQVTSQTATAFQCPAGQQDLAYCTITIDQAAGASPAYSQSSASLRISSFGSCKGVWTFALQVSDGCNAPVSDPFTFNVGCNRAPQVQAGCSTSQTWSGSSFNQISLDGRASTDPDNFGDSFNNLPQLVTTNNQLIYAWSLVSAPGGYLGDNPATWSTCPLRVNITCAEDYCSGSNQISYYSVSPSTGQGTNGDLVTSVDNNFSGSIQGSITTMNSWNDMFNVRIFPTFNPSCAPTVYPKVFTNGQLCTTAACGGAGNQAQHIGNSAFVRSVTAEGTYVFRLSAFDGCTVGSADVSVVLTCPLLAISGTQLFSSGSSITLTTATTGTFSTADVAVTYRGLSSNTVTFAYTLTSGATVIGTPVTGNSVQNGRVAAQNIPIPSAPGAYTLTLTVTDGCQRTTPVAVLTGTVNVNCVANPSGIVLIVTPAGQPGVAYSNNVQLPYTNVSTSATFPSLTVSVSGIATNSSNLQVSGQTLSYDFGLTRNGVAVNLAAASSATNVAQSTNATLSLAGSTVQCATSTAFNGWNFCVNQGSCQSLTSAGTVLGAGQVSAAGTYVLTITPRLNSLAACTGPVQTFTFSVTCPAISTPNVQVASATPSTTVFNTMLLSNDGFPTVNGAVAGSWGTSGNTINDLSPNGQGSNGLPTVPPFQYVQLSPFGTTGGVLPNNAIVTWSVVSIGQDTNANPLNLVAAPVRTSVNSVGWSSVASSATAANTGFLVNGGGLVTCAQAQFWPTFPGTWTISLVVSDGCATSPSRTISVTATCNSTNAPGLTVAAASYYTAAQTAVVQPVMSGNSLTLFWDSYNVLPLFGTNSQRNFNGIGQVFIYTYGENENFFGAFPSLNISSSARTTNRYMVWYAAALQSGVSYCSYGGPYTVSGATCVAIPNQIGYFANNNGFSFTSTQSAFPGQAIMSQNNLGLQVNVTAPGTYNYLALSWNGAVGSSCYSSSTVVVTAQCNSLTGLSVSTTADGNGMNSYFDGSLFQLVDMTGSFQYNQQGCPSCPTTSGFGTGNLYSLQYVWEVMNSPAGSIFGMVNSGSTLVTAPLGTPSVVTFPSVVVTNTSGTFTSTTTNTTQTLQNTLTSVRARLLNHNFNTPRTCFRPDVAGSYTVRLTVRDGCNTWTANAVTITAQCYGLPTFTGGAAGPGVAAFSLTSVSNTNAVAIGTGVTAVTVQGSTNDRITIAANLQAPVLAGAGAGTSGDVYFYSWNVTNAAGSVSVTNSQGPTISFLASQLATSDIPLLSNAQLYTVTLRVSNNCPIGGGSTQTTVYAFTLNVRCALDFPAAGASAVSISTVTLRTGTGSQVGVVSPICTPGTAYCGAYGAGGVPTVLFHSTANAFQSLYVDMTGVFSTQCRINRLSLYLTTVGCALPYTPSAFIPPPPAPQTCAPTVSTFWSVASTPCTICPTNTGGRCEFAGYFGNFVPYQVPTLAGSYCIWDAGRRLAAVANSSLIAQAQCNIAGVGLETTQTNPLFTPRFPGQYVLNYTVIDGCNPPQVQQVTITARCVTKPSANVVTSARSVGYFCNGDASFTGSAQAAGSFENVNLTSLVGPVTTSSSVSTNPVQTSSSACPVVTPAATCADWENQMNAAQAGLFAQCCRCRFGAVSVIIGSSNAASVNAPAANAPSFAEESTTVVAEKQPAFLLGLVVPLSVLAVFSILFNVVMFARLRSRRNV